MGVQLQLVIVTGRLDHAEMLEKVLMRMAIQMDVVNDVQAFEAERDLEIDDGMVMYEVDKFTVEVEGETTVGTPALTFQVSSTHHETEGMKRVVIKDGVQKEVATWHSDEGVAASEKGIAVHLARQFGQYLESEYLL